MKQVLTLLLWLLLSVNVCTARTSARRYTFDQGWTFTLLTDTAQPAPRTVSLPHDWSIELPFSEKEGGACGYLAGGQGLYVKEFTLPRALAEAACLQLVFDGVYHRATVTLNGHELGEHIYGYTGFAFDITPHIVRQGTNRLEVHVSREEKSRWYTGSGIYRHVWLVATERLHVAYNGIAVHTGMDGTVEVEAEVVGGDDYTLRHIVLDASGHKVAQADGSRLTVKEPELWSPDHPALYTLVTQVLGTRRHIADEVRTTFGFRAIQFDSQTGFWLNGKNIKLKGMCLHQDVGSLGVAVPDEAVLRRLRALKDIGCNAVRCSHNPPAPEFLDICDSLGLMVIDEAFDKWKSGYYADFYDACAKGDISDMVRRDRNHPSIILWSIGNEVSEARRKDELGVTRARELQAIVKEIDDSRPTMVACQQGFADKFGDITDVVGYNYLEPRMIADHQRHPERRMVVTEAFPYYSGLREELVRDYVEQNPWHFVEEHPFIAGSFVWAGVDYLGESSPWPAKGWCSCPFDMTLRERPQAAFYHPAWNPDTDYLKLVVRDNCFDQPSGTDHWQYPPMADTWDLPYTDERCVEVRCYTTCDSVQFFVPIWSNPQLPLQPRLTAHYPDHCITLQLPARKGKILAVGYKGGKEVIRDSLTRHGPVADVRLAADYTVLHAVSRDYASTPSQGTMAHIRLTLTDAEGRTQQMEPHRFRAEVEGPIRLLGVETGDMRRETSWRTTELPTYFGEGLIRLQSTSDTGTARLKVFVEGFDQPFVQEFTIR